MTQILPANIAARVSGLACREDDVGRSGDRVLLFEDKYALKISRDGKRLLRERERFLWLCGRLPAPASLAFAQKDGWSYHLMGFAAGQSLLDRRFLSDPPRLIRVLARAAALLRKLDGQACPFLSADSQGNAFVHGDLCLPNILVDENDQVAAFLDVENMGLGDAWYDYAKLLWSLQYNLKTDRWNGELLDALGLCFDKEKYERYVDEEERAALLDN